MEKDVIYLVSNLGENKKKIWSSTWHRTSDIRVPRSDVLTLSYRKPVGESQAITRSTYGTCSLIYPTVFCSSRWSLVVTFYLYQGSKLTLANSHNASDFDNLRVRKISTSKRLLFRIMYVSQTCSRKVVAVKTTAKDTKYLIPFLLNFSTH